MKNEREVSSQGGLAGLSESQLGNAANDFIERRACGENPTVEEYQRKYPEIARAIGDLFPALDLIGNSASAAAEGFDRSTFHRDRRLGDFRIIGELGRGGMGVVYEAEQISMGRRVALKVLPLAGLVDDQKIQRFHNEVRAVAALDHPNIVSVYMVGEERSVHFYAMQLIRGRNFAAVINSLRDVRAGGEMLTGDSLSQVASGRLPAEKREDGTQTNVGRNSTFAGHAETTEASAVVSASDSTIPHTSQSEYFRSVAAFGVQAAKALQHAHEQGVVHRDIKPANLLLDSSAQLYVTDFGLARMEADAGVTMTGDLVGTLRYMAPEQWLSNGKEVDHRADIYSLAVTLYELLILRPAYSGRDRQQLMKQIECEEPLALHRADGTVPRDLETIVHKAMSKDREERYESAAEMAADLGRFLDDRPIRARPPTMAHVINKWARRNPILVWAAVVTMFFVTVTFVVSNVLVTKQRDVARDAKQQAEAHLQRAMLIRLASESRAVQSEEPNLSVLLALEAMKLAQLNSMQFGSDIVAIAHESLLNSTQELRKWRLLNGHETAILDGAMTAKWIVLLGQSGSVQLWDVTARQPSLSITQLSSHGKITSIGVSGDGRWLVTAGKELRRWDLSAMNPRASSHHFADCEQPVTKLRLSADGHLLLETSEYRDRVTHCRLWAFASDDGPSASIVKEHSGCMEKSLDGKRVASVSESRDAIHVWSYAAGVLSKWPFEFRVRFNHNSKIALSPDGQWLAAYVGGDSVVRLWNLNSEDSPILTRLPIHDGAVALGFSRDSRRLFASDYYQTRVFHWNITGTQDISGSKAELRGHTAGITDVAESYDGASLVTGSIDGTVKFWHLEQPNMVPVAFRAHDSVIRVLLHPDGRWLVTLGDELARLWDLRGGDPSSSSFVLRSGIADSDAKSAISSNGRWIATAVDGYAVQLWEPDALDQNDYSRIFVGPSSEIKSLEFSPNDRWLIAGCSDGATHVWDLSSKNVTSSHAVIRPSDFDESRDDRPADDADTQRNGTVAVAPNSRWIAIGRGHGYLSLWDLLAPHDNPSARTIHAHAARVRAMAFSNDGRWLVSASRTGVHMWNLESDAPNASFTISDETEPSSIVIDSDSRWLATVRHDGATLLRDLKSNDPTKVKRVLPRVGASIWRLAISPDARWLFTSRYERSAQLWDLSVQGVPKPIDMRVGLGAQDAAISSKGRWLAGGCGINGQLWDLTAPDPASSVRVLRGHTDKIWSVRFSADERWLITDASDGSVRRWNLDTNWLLNHARTLTGRELTDEEKGHYGVGTLP